MRFGKTDEMRDVVNRLDNLTEEDKLKIAVWLGELSALRKIEAEKDFEDGWEEQCDE